MRSWKEDDDTMGLNKKTRLVVKPKTKSRLLALRGPKYGTSEDAVVAKLLQLAETLDSLFSNGPVSKGLDKESGAPAKVE